ncbi:DUF1538 domain-containing protein [Treponema parvum]|uniref:DUF1538 domain-containing protein n=1 Tax=Treponema parvum TaxID=138851 RepID=A0A975F4M7_9SPIR|nr:DUF1538 domain-containing protein [Treponema parvum]QTQ14297.1 DUF1538 domain-containing protein [Treponema parvum]
MNIIQKFKETASSVLPVMIIVLVLGVTAAPLGKELLFRFIVGGILLIIGLTIFLLGVDIGILPLGTYGGSELTKKRNLPLLLAASFAIGFLVTASEPDIQVLSDQVRSIFPLVNKRVFIMMIASGVGFYIALGLLRTVMRLPLKIFFVFSYFIVFTLAFIAPHNFIGIGFDSGGATTGPMTVPFIMALGIGVSSVRVNSANSKEGGSSQSDNFGLTGMASVGPILAVLLYGVFLSKHAAVIADQEISHAAGADLKGLYVFLSILPHVAREAVYSLTPVVILFIVFQTTLLHMPPRRLARMILGFFYSYIGLTIFLVGVNGGFMTAGRRLGVLLGTLALNNGGLWTFMLVGTGLLIGAVVVCAEPAVWVLTDQVELISGGTIKRKVLLVFLASGAAIAIALAMLRSLFGFNIMYVLIPGYAVALILMIFCPDLFTAIAFDSGGVASGPISSTFVLSFTLGASQASGAHSDAFGVIALIAMTPLIAIQILGLVFNYKKKGGAE